MSMRAFSVHAHFYQPPREDPLTGIIPIEAGASPFPNWNERIHAECYRPNADIGNFSRISFNIGPTLFDWMSGYDSLTYRNIIAQDQYNVRMNGVGNALAQAYNHTILPLASYQDKVTQVFWGIAEFEYQFGRKPQGMWLPETAVDLETLQVLAEQGIEFTILAPWQAQAESLDVTEPYRVALPHGREITVFFYHAGLSGGISFNPALTINADHFAVESLANEFRLEKTQRGEPQLILLASDGELYGHHQPMREFFLKHLVDGASNQIGLTPTYPGLWLKQNFPKRVVAIHENTSWSCQHGIYRWLGSCACTPGDGRWKTHLHLVLERLGRQLDQLYLQYTLPRFSNPWELRNRYIFKMLGIQTVEELIAEVAGRYLPDDDVVRTHILLEAQRERQRMFTSCGWFFDDFDRIEPKNNLAYAAQAVRLARMATGVDLERAVLEDLNQIVSSRTGLRGDRVFLKHMRRAVMDGRIVAGD
jgi:Domain of unknown function (DUF3536)/Glycosyl hydrolase family 57